MTRWAVIAMIIAWILGLLTGFAFNERISHTPDINCNNESANDGPNYEERDITDYEWDKYCNG